MATIAISLWLGLMGFFAFGVAPAAFSTLDREAAGRFVAAVFPRYYMAGAVLGAVALVALLARGRPALDRPGEWLPGALVLAMVALTLYAWLAVLPAAHAAREAMGRASAGAAPAEAATFARLHRLSTVLNGVVMLAGVLFLVVQGRRPS